MKFEKENSYVPFHIFAHTHHIYTFKQALKQSMWMNSVQYYSTISWFEMRPVLFQH